MKRSSSFDEVKDLFPSPEVKTRRRKKALKSPKIIKRI
jgi:hypothetical protein